jgi:hypothetical protein
MDASPFDRGLALPDRLDASDRRAHHLSPHRHGARSEARDDLTSTMSASLRMWVLDSDPATHCPRAAAEHIFSCLSGHLVCDTSIQYSIQAPKSECMRLAQ